MISHPVSHLLGTFRLLKIYSQLGRYTNKRQLLLIFVCLHALPNIQFKKNRVVCQFNLYGVLMFMDRGPISQYLHINSDNYGIELYSFITQNIYTAIILRYCFYCSLVSIIFSLVYIIFKPASIYMLFGLLSQDLYALIR